MPTLDPMSLSAMAGMMAMVIGVLLLLLRRQYPARLPGILLWGSGLLMFTGGTLLYLVNHLFRFGLTTLPGNAMLLCGFALLLMGSQRFVGRPVTWRRLMLWCVCSVSVIAWFLFEVPDYRVRITTFTWTLAGLALLHMRLLLRHRSSWASRYTAGVLLCLGLLMLARGTGTWWVDAPDMHIYQSSRVQGAYLASFGFAVLLLGVGMLFMATERIRAESERIASRDDLTQTLTRRSWMARAHQALAAGPGRQPVAVLMLDIDDFKKINDQQGHLAGDHVLAALAGAMARALPADGLLGRYGGEEFIVLLTGPSAQRAREVAEDLRQAVAVQDELGCTVSIGLATAVRDGGPLERLIQRADQVLYQAKRQGRNQVVVAGEGEGRVTVAGGLAAARAPCPSAEGRSSGLRA